MKDHGNFRKTGHHSHDKSELGRKQIRQEAQLLGSQHKGSSMLSLFLYKVSIFSLFFLWKGNKP